MKARTARGVNSASLIFLCLLIGACSLGPKEQQALSSRNPSSRQKTYGNVIVDEVTSVYDGDTFKCNIKAYPAVVGYNIPVRIYGIDCPEIRGSVPEIRKLARQAKQFTAKKLQNARQIKLVNLRRGKYFRLVAEVQVDGQSLARLLLQNHLAKPYYGGKKPKWLEKAESQDSP